MVMSLSQTHPHIQHPTHTTHTPNNQHRASSRANGCAFSSVYKLRFPIILFFSCLTVHKNLTHQVKPKAAAACCRNCKPFRRSVGEEPLLPCPIHSHAERKEKRRWWDEPRCDEAINQPRCPKSNGFNSKRERGKLEGPAIARCVAFQGWHGRMRHAPFSPQPSIPLDARAMEAGPILARLVPDYQKDLIKTHQRTHFILTFFFWWRSGFDSQPGRCVCTRVLQPVSPSIHSLLHLVPTVSSMGERGGEVGTKNKASCRVTARKPG